MSDFTKADQDWIDNASLADLKARVRDYPVGHPWFMSLPRLDAHVKQIRKLESIVALGDHHSNEE